MGTPTGNSGLLAVAWSVGIGLVGYLWAKRLFNRDPAAIVGGAPHKPPSRDTA